ncbi:hypothetical protein ACWFMI_26590, partial [Nocardiopsis terrae]
MVVSLWGFEVTEERVASEVPGREFTRAWGAVGATTGNGAFVPLGGGDPETSPFQRVPRDAGQAIAFPLVECGPVQFFSRSAVVLGDLCQKVSLFRLVFAEGGVPVGGGVVEGGAGVGGEVGLGAD